MTHSLPDILDLDAALFAPYLASVTERIANLAEDRVSQIADVGAGTGAGTFALLDRFPAARVTAVDSDPEMLANLAGKAAERGLGDRVRTVVADAGERLPGVAGADLVWASASMHHIGDPGAALAAIRDALRPGGLVAIAELDGMPRFLADEALETRLREALSTVHAHHLPHLGADWGKLLTKAGFVLEHESTEDLTLRRPLPAEAGRYARLVLARQREGADGHLAADDRAALDKLLGGDLGEDLVVRSTRELWIARRPGQSA